MATSKTVMNFNTNIVWPKVPFPKTKNITCELCGYPNHSRWTCNATYTITGDNVEELVMNGNGSVNIRFPNKNCLMCGRDSHGIDQCYAIHDIHGRFIMDYWIGHHGLAFVERIASDTTF